MIKTLNNVTFDDVANFEDENDWSYLCKDCLTKYNFDSTLLGSQDPAKDTTCGVKDCWNGADYYIDFPED